MHHLLFHLALPKEEGDINAPVFVPARAVCAALCDHMPANAVGIVYACTGAYCAAAVPNQRVERRALVL